MDLITGSTDGIGLETAAQLLKRGHRVWLHGRSDARCRSAAQSLLSKTRRNPEGAFVCDLSDLAGVRRFAGEVRERCPGLRALVLNAGVYEKTLRHSSDGYEMTFAVNHLAHFLLTLSLVDVLVRNAPSRIVVVSSTVHHNADPRRLEDPKAEKGFDGYGAYAASKLANLFFTYELARRLEGTGVTANALHPGAVSTKLLHAGWGAGGIRVEEGAKTSVYLADADEAEHVTGQYFAEGKPAESSAISHDRRLAKTLWDASERMTGVSWPRMHEPARPLK